MSTTYSPQQLRRRLDRLPRLRLAALPTPLDELPRLSAAVGGPQIWMKREDLTGLAFGGNKIREFEYSIAQAVEAGCDVLVHGAASQSNQSRQTAAVAAKLGMKAVQVGRADGHAQLQGNLLLTHLFGAEVLLPPAAEQAATLESLRQAGHKPFSTSSDGAAYRGIAYVDGFLELWAQLQERNVRPDVVYVASGAHTHTGMVVAPTSLGVPLRFVGIS
ncbi:MAG: pyridoxal-phosphate dependent enzyme, partial [bacterium]|nr:pyridoxal-phosphate dependent enzyme [bacterium]